MPICIWSAFIGMCGSDAWNSLKRIQNYYVQSLEFPYFYLNSIKKSYSVAVRLITYKLHSESQLSRCNLYVITSPPIRDGLLILHKVQFAETQGAKQIDVSVFICYNKNNYNVYICNKNKMRRGG